MQIRSPFLSSETVELTYWISFKYPPTKYRRRFGQSLCFIWTASVIIALIRCLQLPRHPTTQTKNTLQLSSQHHLAHSTLHTLHAQTVFWQFWLLTLFSLYARWPVCGRQIIASNYTSKLASFCCRASKRSRQIRMPHCNNWLPCATLLPECTRWHFFQSCGIHK